MKTVFFLRGSWRKDKKASPAAASTPDSEHVHFDASSSPLSKLTHYDSPSLHTLQFESLPPVSFSLGDSDDDASHSSQGTSGQAERRVPDRGEKLGSYQTRFGVNGNHGALLNTAHGPPQNSFHGPPYFNRPSRTARPKTAPSRPPRPPSPDLYSHTRPVSATPRSPNRVKFAPAPQIRPLDSPSRHSFRYLDQTNTCIADLPNDRETTFNPDRTAPQHAESPSHVVAERHNQMAPKCICLEEHSLGVSTCPLSPSHVPLDPHRTAHATLDLLDLPSPRGLYHATVSSPHLPIVEDKSAPGYIKNDRERRPTLALFPSPPPLLIRKRPKPLVLLPAPNLVRLPPSPAFPSPAFPPSPAFSSADSTPPMTPTPRPLQSSLSNGTVRKSPGRFLSSIPPPTCSPPNTPLPTPPTSPSTHGSPITRQLRSVHSTADLRSQHPQPSGGHRPTLSTPSSESHRPNRRHTHTRPDVPAASSHLRAKGRMETTPHVDSPIQWGYAL